MDPASLKQAKKISSPQIFIMVDDSQSVASHSVAPATSIRGIRDHIKKQFAEDIEANGGIVHFTGSDNKLIYWLCQERVNDDDNPYGPKSDPLRTKLRRLANYWKAKNKQGKYISDILNPWGIVQYSARVPKPPLFQPNQQPLPQRRDSFDLSSDSSSNLSVLAVTPPRDQSKKASHKTPPRPPSRKTPQRQQQQQQQQTPPPPRDVFVDQTNTPISPLIDLLNKLDLNNMTEPTSTPPKRKMGTDDDDLDWDSIAKEAGT